MQSAAFSLSPSISLLKLRRPSSPTLACRFDPICVSSSSKIRDLGNSSKVAVSAYLPCRSWSLGSSSSSSFKFRPWSSLPESVNANSDANRFQLRATSVPESAGESADSNSWTKTLELGALFGLWYLFNIYFNIYNKQVLKVFPYPVTTTLVQFALGSVRVLSMWGFNLYKKPKVNGSQLAAIVPLAVIHTLGNLFTNVSLEKVAVSFTHTIKAMEPFFSVVLSAMFLGVLPTLWVVSSLVPIVGGVALLHMLGAKPLPRWSKAKHQCHRCRPLSANPNTTLSCSANPPVRITLAVTGEHFFSCSFNSHCPAGQKIAINVTRESTATPPSSATSPSSGGAPSPSGSTTPMTASPPQISGAESLRFSGLSATFLSVALAL